MLQVLVVGAVISLVAQSLTLISVLRRLHTHPSESASLILLNAELALTAGNLVFMFGVQVTFFTLLFVNLFPPISVKKWMYLW